MDQETWDKLVATHGGIVGKKPLYTAQELRDHNGPYETPLPEHPPQQIVFADNWTTEAILYDDGSVDQTSALKPPPKGVTNPTANRILASGSSPSDKYIVTTDGQGNTVKEENPNYVPPKAPDTVPGSGTPGSVDYSGTSTGGSDPSGPGFTPGTPDVPVDVYRAQTDRQNADRAAAQATAAAARQAANDAWARENDRIQNDLAQGRLTLAQAQQAATEAHQRISEELDRSAQGLTARGQDITMRGQDITERGQDLNYLASRPYTTAGQFNNVQSLIGQAAQGAGMSYTPSQPTPLGYDPAEIGKRIAQQVMSQPAQKPQLGPQFSMAGS